MIFPRKGLLGQITTSSALIGWTLFAGCASTKVVEAPALPTHDLLRGLELFDGTTGDSATWTELEKRVDEADVVIIGELHAHPLGLPYAALLYEGSLERHENTALSLEFVTRDRQFALDAYVAGIIDWEGLGKTMRGSRGCDVNDHKQMIVASKDAGRPVYAANAPRIYTTAARKLGYEALVDLSPEQQRMFDIPAKLPSEAYQQRFFEFMNGGHDGDEGGESEVVEPTEAMRSVFRSQALWDGTMSSSTARAIRDGNKPVFLVVGQFHCDTNGGTLELLRRKQPNANILVISVSDTWSETLRKEDEGRADFIVYVGPFPERDE
ncbi:MAG: ChaN family lipoprotein [bacterium]|nr:ChaN family lipoprotein [bacterium]